MGREAAAPAQLTKNSGGGWQPWQMSAVLSGGGWLGWLAGGPQKNTNQLDNGGEDSFCAVISVPQAARV